MKTKTVLNKHEGMSRVSAWVPDEQHRQAKAIAALRGIDLQDYTAEAFAEKLASDSHPQIIPLERGRV